MVIVCGPLENDSFWANPLRVRRVAPQASTRQSSRRGEGRSAKAGAAARLHLVWLAVDVLRVRNQPSRSLSLSHSRKPILDGLTIAFANPASLDFHAAFFPQFVDTELFDPRIMLGAMYIGMVLAFDSACVLTVARLRLPARAASVR